MCMCVCVCMCICISDTSYHTQRLFTFYFYFYIFFFRLDLYMCLSITYLSDLFLSLCLSHTYKVFYSVADSAVLRKPKRSPTTARFCLPTFHSSLDAMSWIYYSLISIFTYRQSRENVRVFLKGVSFLMSNFPSKKLFHRYIPTW